MPQLLSRRDEAGWLTPAMADILTQSPASLPGEETLRNQLAEIQQRLGEQDTPVRITDVRPSPSHTLFIARPEPVGRLSNRRPVSPNDIRRSLGVIADQHKDWVIGFINRLPDDEENVGILLRTEQHQPLQLRQLLISNTFVNRPSTLSVILGVTLQQQVILRDLEAIENLVIVGSENSRRHVINEILLTLLMMNTPAELRVALIGSSIKQYSELPQAPHTLGKVVDTPEAGVRLLDGMVKEGERRRQWLQEQDAADFEIYNRRLHSRGEMPLPRILIFFDSLSDADWQEDHERWQAAIYDLLINGAKVGIHLMLTANETEDLPEVVERGGKTRIIMRSAKSDLADNLKYLHSSALRFIDAFIVTSQGAKKETEVQPVELCTINGDDLKALVNYWRKAGIQRTQEIPENQRTGLTGILPDLESDQGISNAAARPVNRPITSSLARATYALSGSTDERLLKQAQALAAYLGWLGIGPLRDVLGLSTAEARATLEALQSTGVIESGEGNMLRFMRLAANPLNSDDSPE